jgi:hypothetical protein
VPRRLERVPHELIDHGALRRQQRHLGARPACHGGKPQPRRAPFVILRAAGDLQAVPPVGRLVFERHALEAAVALAQVLVQHEARIDSRALRQSIQRFERENGPVLEQFDQLDLADPLRLARSRERLVRLLRAADEREDGIGHRHAARAGANQQRRHAQPGRGGRHRLRRRLETFEHVFEQCTVEGPRERGSRQGADRAETDDNRAPRPGISIGGRPRIAEHGARLDRPWIESEVQAPAQGAVQRPVEVLLGADDRVPRVMTDRHRISRERQVAVDDAHAQQISAVGWRGPRDSAAGHE